MKPVVLRPSPRKPSAGGAVSVRNLAAAGHAGWTFAIAWSLAPEEYLIDPVMLPAKATWNYRKPAVRRLALRIRRSM